ncbi:Regulator of RpoS [subsurface metagenome]|nr:response regulator [bacterium]
MKKRVLVVDHEPKLCSILTRVLSEQGYDVQVADNGRRALEVIPQFNPHLVIADVALPQMDGFELCRRIRSDARFKAIRFIFLTAKDAREDEIEGLSVGADDYITKPLDVDKLLARLDARLRWLDKVEESKECNGIIEGSLAGRNLLDVLQILELGQKQGELRVNQGDKETRIFVSEGEIVFAECGAKKGKLAVYTALTWPDGRFCFTPLAEVEGKEHLEITPLLLEWAKVSDEIARRKPASSEDIVGEFLHYVKEREGKEEE